MEGNFPLNRTIVGVFAPKSWCVYVAHVNTQSNSNSCHDCNSVDLEFKVKHSNLHMLKWNFRTETENNNICPDEKID